MHSVRVVLVRTLLAIALLVLAFPVHPARLTAQGGDLQVWVQMQSQEYYTWVVDYRAADGRAVASYSLPGLPLQFDSQSAGRFAGSDLETIVLFDPRVGQVIHLPVPNLPSQAQQAETDWYTVSGVALAPDGRYAYNITRLPQDYEQQGHTTIYVATPGANNDRAIFDIDTEPYFAVQPYKWRADGGALMLHDMPQGIGGYILFWTYKNVHALDVNTGQLTLLGDSVDGITEDFSMIATMEVDQDYRPTAIAITDFTTNAITRYPMPALPETVQTGGGAIFSPDHSKVAYQVARQNPDQEKFWTIVVDFVAGTSRVVFEEEAAGYELSFGALGGWLDNNTLAIGNYWHQGATSVLLDVTTGAQLGTVPGAFAGYARGVTSAAGFAPSGAIGVACAGAPATRLSAGGRGRITFTDGTMTNVRSYPNTDADKLASMPEGSTFAVIQGPTCANGFAWWELSFDNGVSGWVAEGTPQTYFLEPWQ